MRVRTRNCSTKCENAGVSIVSEHGIYTARLGDRVTRLEVITIKAINNTNPILLNLMTIIRVHVFSL